MHVHVFQPFFPFSAATIQAFAEVIISVQFLPVFVHAQQIMQKIKKKIEKQHQSKLRFEKKEWGKGITKSKATEIPYKLKNVDVNLPLS